MSVISVVPVEVLSNIMRFMTVSDRKMAALVNRRWYEASLDPALVKQTRCTFNSCTSLRETMSILQNRIIFDLTLKNVDSSLSTRSEFISSSAHIFRHLETLSLNGSDVTEPVFISLLSQCTALRSLDVSGCNSLFMSGQLLSRPEDCNRVKQTLSQVVQLKLSSIRYLSDLTFNRFVLLCPSLQSISLANNNIILHADVYYGGEGVGVVAGEGKGGGGRGGGVGRGGGHGVGARGARGFLRLAGRIGIVNGGKATMVGVGGGCVAEGYVGGGDREVKVDMYRANSAVLSFANILHFISSVSRQLKVVDFSSTSINNAILSSLTNLDGLELSELFLAGCKAITEAGLTAVCETQPSLTVLDISDCMAVSDKSIAAIACHLGNLKVLCLSKCPQLTDLSLCQLKSLQLLQSLDLTACYTITSLGLNSGLVHSSTMLNLTSLLLPYCSLVNDIFVVDACRYLPRLTQFDLTQCCISNRSIHAISKYLVQLRELRLSGCELITDTGLLGLPDSDADLHRHDEGDVGRCRCTRTRNLPVIFNPPRLLKSMQNLHGPRGPNEELKDLVPLSNLKKLRLLDLTSCYKLTDRSVTQVMTFKELKALHLSNCPRLTDHCLLVISTHVRGLEELHLAQCLKLTDDGLINLTKHLMRLATLNISSCTQLTNRTIEALYLNTKYLRSLDVSQCSNISLEAVEMLENSFVHLISVEKKLLGANAY